MNHPAGTAAAHDLVRGHITLGDFDLTILTDGPHLQDGGAMFGVVPKTMWQKRAPANELNQIVLGTNTVVVRTGKADRSDRDRHRQQAAGEAAQDLRRQAEASRELSRRRHQPEEVDIVINSHLHFDHCGWNTTKLDNGRVVPHFPMRATSCTAERWNTVTSNSSATG